MKSRGGKCVLLDPLERKHVIDELEMQPGYSVLTAPLSADDRYDAEIMELALDPEECPGFDIE